MGFMSYYQFEGTLKELEQCHERIDEELSESEHKSRVELIKLCRVIAAEFEDCSDDDLENLPHRDY